MTVDGGLLWERLGVPRVEAMRAQGIADAQIGAELAECAGATVRRLRERHGFECAYVAGGLTQIEGFAAASSRQSEVVVDPEGRFAGERGGLALLAQLGYERGAVVDVGQTGIKASLDGRRLVVERDRQALPFEFIDPSGAPPRASGMRLSAAAAFIGGAIAELDASALVLALPCPLDDACVPGPCTYGWEGETRLVQAILEASGRSFREVLVLNDAELAAETARLACPGRRTLVITLGFGPGGALLEA
jgi:hypothetical protein